MSTETTVSNLKINKVTKAQYDTITKSSTEAYEITDLGSVLDGKQATLVSGTNIKTINNTSLLGSGNISISGGSATTVKINGTSITSSGVADIKTNGTYNASSNKIATMSDVPAAVTETTVSGWGFTKNTGTVTSVNNVSPTNGNVTLTIPAAQVQSNWNETNTSSKAYIQNKPSLATVATSGSYNDLSNKPTIPTVNNATLTITQGGVSKGTFTANASSNVTIALDGSSGGSSRNIGEIVASTIPLTDAGLHLLDGSLIQRASYSDFVDHIGSIYANAADVLNINKIGSLTNNNGVISGFSTSNYATLPSRINASVFEIRLKIKTAATAVTGGQKILAIGDQTDESKAIFIACNNAGTQMYFIHYSPNTAFTTINISNNTTYYLKVVSDGTTVSAYTSTSGFDSMTLGGSTPLVNAIQGTVYLGYEPFYTSKGAFGGSIDLNESYIKVGGSSWWNGVTKVGFTTEEDWQTSVTNYGVCGKFVYNSTNKTVRLPKITGFVEGASGTVTLGNLTEAGLPNIEGALKTFVDLGRDEGTGAIRRVDDGSRYQGTGTGSGTKYDGFDFDASRSSSIYGNSTTVQPQSIKVLYYIVIATITKTDIQVDIDEIATDLNGKADRDLSNIFLSSAFAMALNAVGVRTIVETYSNGASWYRIWSDNWCEQGGAKGSNVGTIAFIKQFANTDYYFNEKVYKTGSSASAYNFYSAKTTSNITILQTTEPGYWFACGYVA